MRIRNFTPHNVTLYRNGVPAMVLESQGIVRLSTSYDKVESDNIPLCKVTYGEPEGLPDKEEDVLLVVSSLVFNALQDRYDLIVPTDFVRDENGNIIGCNSFQCR